MLILVMVNVLNNVDLDKVSKTLESAKSDPTSLKKPVKLHGEWNLDPSKDYQFKTELSFEKGKQVIEIDSPSFLGGGGNRLGPMAYCAAGIASCFISTFVNIASENGVRLSRLSVTAECNINFAKTFGLADEPITEGINFQVDAHSDNADKQKLHEILKLAEERCPAVYSLSHVVKVEAHIQ